MKAASGSTLDILLAKQKARKCKKKLAKANEAKCATVVKSAAAVQGVSTAPFESITLCIPSIPSKDFATDCVYDFDVQEPTTNKSTMNNDIDEDTYEDMYEDSQQAVLEGDQNEGEGKAGRKPSTMAQKRKIARFVQSDSEEGEKGSRNVQGRKVVVTRVGRMRTERRTRMVLANIRIWTRGWTMRARLTITT